MREPQNFCCSFEQFYHTISPKVKDNLTHEQLQAIKIAYESTNHRQPHSLEMKVSLPIPGLRFYIVLLAGKESRAKKRLRYDKSVYPLRNPVNILFLLLLVIIFLISTFTILNLVLSSFSCIPSSPYPTSIPWINNQSDCERTNRNWYDGKCWDAEHNPTF